MLRASVVSKHVSPIEMHFPLHLPKTNLVLTLSTKCEVG